MPPLHLLDVPFGVLSAVADDHEPEPERSLDLRLVATDLLAPAPEDLVLVTHEVEVSARVPGVRVLRHRVQRLLLAVATDEDRQVLLQWWRVVADVRRPIQRSSGRGFLAVQHRTHDLDGLVEPVEPLPEPGTEVDAVRFMLAPEPRTADAEDGAPVAHVVERRDEL